MESHTMFKFEMIIIGSKVVKLVIKYMKSYVKYILNKNN